MSKLAGIVDAVILNRSARTYFIYKPGARERIVAGAKAVEWKSLDVEQQVDVLAELLKLEEVSIFPLPESAYAFP